MEREAESQAGNESSQAQVTHASLRVDLISLFPEYFSGPLAISILGRAQEKGALDVRLVDLRRYGEGNYRRVDDRPYGGGPGMVLMPGPIKRAVRDVKEGSSRVIYMSPQGRPLTAAVAKRLAKEQHLILLCGHYEGVDERAIASEVDEEICIGDYVLTNGCLPALVLLDAVVRFLPGVLSLGAAEEESFQKGHLDWPHYTRPLDEEGQLVPEVLRGGDHKAIAAWRLSEAVLKTASNRPDLFNALVEGVRSGGSSRTGALLWVSDLAASLRFYSRNLGWQIGIVEETRASVTGPSIEVVLVQGPQRAVAPVKLWIEEGQSAVEELKKRGLPFALQGEGGEQRVEVCDPDGHIWSIKPVPERNC